MKHKIPSAYSLLLPAVFCLMFSVHVLAAEIFTSTESDFSTPAVTDTDSSSSILASDAEESSEKNTWPDFISGDGNSSDSTSEKPPSSAQNEDFFISGEDSPASRWELFDDGSILLPSGSDEPDGIEEEDSESQLEPFSHLTNVLTVPDPVGSVYPDPVAKAAASFPSAYNTGRQFISEARNQDPYGMCWAFTTTCGMETYLRRNGMDSGSLDFSEEHIAYFLSHRVPDPLGNTIGDQNNIASTAQYAYREGGNQILTTLFLSTWSGLADESLVPYPTDSTHTAKYESNPDPSLAYQDSAYLTETAYSSYSVAAAKELIMRYGSVGTSLLMNTGYYNTKTFSYSYPKNAAPNHAVTLVGWDDSFSHENFRSTSKVTSDGAWIALNSWGPSWGDKGFFYISYECKSLVNMTCVAGTSHTSYPNNYFYDGSSSFIQHQNLYPKGEGSSDSIANIFQIKAAGGNAEALGEIVLEDYSYNSSYSVQIYTNLTDLNNPASGTPVFDIPMTVTKKYPGIVTVPLSQEITLAAGTYFSVVLTNIGSDITLYLLEESGEVDTGWIFFDCNIEHHQSFLKNGDAWLDLANFDCCARIKAHTRSLSAPLSLHLDGAGEMTAGDTSRISSSVSPGKSFYSLLLSSSDPSVASIAADGTVTALKSGTTTISGRLAGLGGDRVTASFRLTVKAIPAPALNAAGISYRRIRLTWSAVPGAFGYRIYRSVNGSDFRKIKSVGNSVLSYDDLKVRLGAGYRYRIRAYRKVYNGTKNVYGKYSSSISCSAAALDTPAITSCSALSGRKARLRWSAISGRTGYAVYRRKGTTGNYSFAGNVTKGTAFTDSKLTAGSVYYYKIRAYRVVDGKKYFSKFSNIVKIRAKK